MSLLLLEGPAGSGKTTGLIEEVRRFLTSAPMADGQRVLALTKMHGSRRRMEAKLGTELHPTPADCQTIDSFALHINRRFRDLAQVLVGGAPPGVGDFQGQCDLAGRLLAEPTVARWVAGTYPVVVVDELQDSKGGQIRVIEGLTRTLHCICAADEFQDLTGDTSSNAASWARGHCTPRVLAGNHRTSVSGLLAAASALRAGTTGPLVSVPRQFVVRTCASAAHAGAFVSWEITSSRSEQCRDIAILSPTGSDSSVFVRDVVNWVTSKPATTKRNSATSGPHRIRWESAAAVEADDIINALSLDVNCAIPLALADLEASAREIGADDLSASMKRRRILRGESTISAGDAISCVQHAVSLRRSFGTHRGSSVSAMTIHGAKNREFDAVVVLWPREVRKGEEMHRRLLYNAITRARRRVLVVVHDTKGKRIAVPPFCLP